MAVGNPPTLPLCECTNSTPGGQTGAQFIAGEPGFTGSHSGSAPLPRQTAQPPGSPVVVAPEEQGKFPTKQSRQEHAILLAQIMGAGVENGSCDGKLKKEERTMGLI